MQPDHQDPTPESGSAVHPFSSPGRQQDQESSPTNEAEAAVAAPSSIPVVAPMKVDDGDGDGDGDGDDCDDGTASPLTHRTEGAVSPLSATAPAPRTNPRHNRPHRLVRMLVVADLDLRSAAQLAEFAIRDREDFADDPFAKKGRQGRKGVDLCLACGPFSPIPYDEVWDEYHSDVDDGDDDEDINTSAEDERQEELARRLREACRERWKSSSESNLPSASAAAAEGGTTCILSQLETIVCRVVFCPSADVDPPRMTSSWSVEVADGSGRRVSYERRYTPNARSVHGRWLQLAPGLGVAGYSPRDEDEQDGDDGEEDGCWDGSGGYRQRRRRRGKLDKSEEWMDQGCFPEGKHDASETRYESTVRGLLSLAPPCSITSPVSRTECNVDHRSQPSQAILVTPFGFTPPDDDRRSAHVQPDSEVTCDPPPSRCPAHHDRLMRSAQCREQVLLSIVTSLPIDDGDGGGATGQFEYECTGVRVVSPGSLRERGEFAIVDVVVYEGEVEPRDEEDGLAVDDVITPPSQRWTVWNVKFRSMENERRFYSW